MKSFANKTVAITGAGSGLGRALALRFHAEGARLALCDLDLPGLEETRRLCGAESGRVSIRRVDVTDREQVNAWADESIQIHGQIDVLINNAGITLSPKLFDEISHDHFEKVIRVNMWGVYNGIRAFLPHLRTRPEAAIVNMSSLAGQVGLTGYAPYAMSKFAVRGLSETLQAELSETKISVLAVYPGGVKTNIIKNAPDLDEKQRQSAHDVFTRTAMLSADDAARKIMDGIIRKRNELVLGNDARLVLMIRALFPRRFPAMLHSIFKQAMFR